ncbi:MAG: beta-ketoacyl-[acyl-carrier-protein] synthase family protein [Candidatus Omnitrophica bacterium]|nr:beta-ketoacyl-[acyl-carrier-protein] synthase family protein [Candidatus Omnitrophota bacterium]
MERRVVATGVGIVSPLGNNVGDTWQHMLESRSGVSYITLFDASTFPTKIAGEVKGFNFTPWVKQDSLLAHVGRNTQFAVYASGEAYRDAGLDRFDYDSKRMGIYFAAGDGGVDLKNFIKSLCAAWGNNGEVIDKKVFLKKGPEIYNPYAELEQEPCMTLAHLARLFRARGPVSNCLTACAASSQAIGEAYETIRRGDADIMLTGGAHSMIHPFGVAGFNLLTALTTKNENPTKASRPFDFKRDGFVLAEGSGVLILEELEFAKKRKAKIYGEIIGYGSTADAYRLTDSHPEGRGAIKAMELALSSADIKPEDVDYINAHGTSTVVNDMVETLAIKKVFGEYGYKVPISSIKSMLGHLIAAAGAVELVTSFLVIEEGKIPPTINFEEQDPDCDLDYVPNYARACKVDTVLSNSFGFGGQNITLVARKFTS